MKRKALVFKSQGQLAPILFESSKSPTYQSRTLSTVTSENLKLNPNQLPKELGSIDYSLLSHRKNDQTKLSADLNALSPCLSEKTLTKNFINEGSIEGILLGSPSARKEVQKLIE